MAEYTVEGKITFDATQATNALKNVTQTANSTATATAKVGDASKSAQTNIGQFGSALGLAGQAAGQLSPALGSVVSVAGSATGVIQGLTTAGLGPLGMAVAAVSVAITAGVGIWKAYTGQTEEAKRKTEALTRAIDGQVMSLDDIIDRNRRIAEQNARSARIAAGGGTREELQAAVEQAQQIVNRNAQRLALARGATMGSAETPSEQIIQGYRILAEELGLGGSRLVDVAGQREAARASDDLQTATRRLAAARQRLAEAEGRGFAVIEESSMLLPGMAGFEEAAARTGRGRRGGGGRGGGGRVAAGPTGPTLDELMQRGTTDRAFGLQGLDIASLGRGDEDWMVEQDNARAKQAAADQADAAEKLRLAEEVSKERQRIEDEMNSALLGSLESALSSSVDAWLSGTRSMGEAMQDMVKQVAKSLASEAIIQGLKETALGIGALASGSPTAAVHFAAAGKWAAVGVAAGLVGAATGAFGGGGGGGGAGPAAATGGPALTAGAREGAGTTVVINWGSSGLVYAADRAQLGRDISGMISEANGRLGRGM